MTLLRIVVCVDFSLLIFSTLLFTLLFLLKGKREKCKLIEMELQRMLRNTGEVLLGSN